MRVWGKRSSGTCFGFKTTSSIPLTSLLCGVGLPSHLSTSNHYLRSVALCGRLGRIAAGIPRRPWTLELFCSIGQFFRYDFLYVVTNAFNIMFIFALQMNPPRTRGNSVQNRRSIASRSGLQKLLPEPLLELGRVLEVLAQVTHR